MMDILSEWNGKSTPTLEIGKKNSELIDRESAYELLNKKISKQKLK
jgi:hypothetical protein